MTSTPLVSVITPCYNAADTLKQTIRSVVAQTMPDWEMIIIDDGSSDASPQVIRDWTGREPRIRSLRLARNLGVAEARNAGIRAARGRYIAFLDSDDLWHPPKLAVQLAFMGDRRSPLVFSAYRLIDAQGNPFGTVAAPPRVSYRQLLRGNVIGCLTAVFDTMHFGKPEMPAIRKRQDFGLWLRLLKTTPYAHGLNEVLADYRIRPGSLSHDKFAAAKATWRLYRDVERLPLPQASYYFGQYALGGVTRRWLQWS